MKNRKTKEQKPNRIISIFLQLYSRITKRKKKQMYLLVLAILVNAMIRTVALGAIAVFIASLSSPERALNSRYVEYIKNTIQLGLFDNSVTFIAGISILVLILVIFKNIGLALTKYGSVLYSAGLQAYFGDMLLQGFLYAEYIWYVKENPSNIINAINWRAQIGSFFLGFFQLLTDIFFVAIVLLGLFLIQPVVTLVVFGLLGSAAGFIYFRIKTRVDWESKKVRDLKRESFRDASKAVHGIKDVKIFLKEQYFSQLFSARVYRLAKLLGRQQVLAAAPSWFLETIGFLVFIVTILVMMLLLQLTTAAVFSIIALIAVAAWKTIPALNRISSSLTRMLIKIPYIETILSYLGAPPKEVISHTSNTRRGSPILSTVIRVHNISFSYSNNGEYALRNVSFSIEKGQTVGIIGHSGAGKSTIVDIFIGLLKPNEGYISIDGQNFTEDLMISWRSAIGYVPQFPYIFHGTLAENIAFGELEKNIDKNRLLQVCKMASIDFLDRLSDSVDTVIGERGIRLSGGQRQRVAIARALYRDPEVLIFDEATSSLDTQSEREIQDTIYSFKDERTLVIIAHRLTTVEGCDKLIWLENGSIVAVGNASEILSKYRQEY